MEQASSYWQSETVFTLLQVGYLWVNLEPPPDEEFFEHEKPKLNSLTKAQMLNSFVKIPPGPSALSSHFMLEVPFKQAAESLLSHQLRPKPLPHDVKTALVKLMNAILAGQLPASDYQSLKWKFDPVFLYPGYVNNLAEIELNRDDLIDYVRLLKVDLPKFLQEYDKAAEARRQGMSERNRKSFERTAKAVFLVGKWVGEKDLAPAEVTKERMQSFLMDNDFKAVEQKLFDDVWKFLPSAEKNRGGRPPNK